MKQWIADLQRQRCKPWMIMKATLRQRGKCPIKSGRVSVSSAAESGHPCRGRNTNAKLLAKVTGISGARLALPSFAKVTGINRARLALPSFAKVTGRNGSETLKHRPVPGYPA